MTKPSKKTAGVVYVLSNPVMWQLGEENIPLIKIGKTQLDKIAGRMQSLYNASVPVQFKCEFAVKVKNPDETEKTLHEIFSPYRVNKNSKRKEFFAIEPETVVRWLSTLGIGKDITKTFIKEAEKSLNNTDREAFDQAEQKARRPRMNFLELGIPINAEIVLIDDPTQKAVVKTGTTVTYAGKSRSLSALTQELLDVSVARGTEHWKYNERPLLEIYDAFHGARNTRSARPHRTKRPAAKRTKKKSSARPTRQPRPTMRFSNLGIPVGAELVFVNNKDIKVTVASDRKVTYQGKSFSLSPLTRELLGLKTNPRGGDYWTYNRRKLSKIYDEKHTR